MPLKLLKLFNESIYYESTILSNFDAILDFYNNTKLCNPYFTLYTFHAAMSENSLCHKVLTHLAFYSSLFSDWFWCPQANYVFFNEQCCHQYLFWACEDERCLEFQWSTGGPRLHSQNIPRIPNLNNEGQLFWHLIVHINIKKGQNTRITEEKSADIKFFTQLTNQSKLQINPWITRAACTWQIQSKWKRINQNESFENAK